MTLADRIIDFLKRHEGDWISKRALGRLARAQGFSYEVTTFAFDLVEATVNIGVIYDKGAYYRWYDMSNEEKDFWITRYAEFEALS